MYVFCVLITETDEHVDDIGGYTLQDNNTDEEDIEEDIFTKSLAPYNLKLKNFLDIRENQFNVKRIKKISDISEIYAFNISQEKVKKLKYYNKKINFTTRWKEKYHFKN